MTLPAGRSSCGDGAPFSPGEAGEERIVPDRAEPERGRRRPVGPGGRARRPPPRHAPGRQGRWRV